jgi:hypothetical protein
MKVKHTRHKGKHDSSALVGFKGASFFDTGIVYAPYIPLITARTIPEIDFNPMELRTRFAHKVVNPNYYGRVTIIDDTVVDKTYEQKFDEAIIQVVES